MGDSLEVGVVPQRPGWRARSASMLSTAGHEGTTAVLPGLVVGLHPTAPAVLGAIEAVGIGAYGLAKFTGAELARRPQRRRRVSAVGHAGIGLAGAVISVATSVVLVGTFRVASWAARGLRSPIRPGQALEASRHDYHGRSVGYERAFSYLAAAVGPLVAVGLLAVLPLRATIAVLLVPVAIAVILALRAAPPAPRSTTPSTLPPPRPDTMLAPPSRLPIARAATIRERLVVLGHGACLRHLIAVGAFHLSNFSATILLLRATKLLDGTYGSRELLQAIALLYALYQLSAAAAARPAGALSDRFRPGPVVAFAAVVLLGAYCGFAYVHPGDPFGLALCFVAAGAASGAIDTVELAGVAYYSPQPALWTGVGLVTAIQTSGRLVATFVAGGLWTLISPQVGLLYCAPLLVIAAVMSLANLAPIRTGARLARVRQ